MFLGDWPHPYEVNQANDLLIKTRVSLQIFGCNFQVVLLDDPKSKKNIPKICFISNIHYEIPFTSLENR